MTRFAILRVLADCSVWAFPDAPQARRPNPNKTEAVRRAIMSKEYGHYFVVGRLLGVTKVTRERTIDATASRCFEPAKAAAPMPFSSAALFDNCGKRRCPLELWPATREDDASTLAPSSDRNCITYDVQFVPMPFTLSRSCGPFSSPDRLFALFGCASSARFSQEEKRCVPRAHPFWKYHAGDYPSSARSTTLPCWALQGKSGASATHAISSR